MMGVPPVRYRERLGVPQL